MSRLTRKSLKTDMIWFVDHDNNMELEPCEMSPIHNRLVLQKLAEIDGITVEGPTSVNSALVISYHFYR